MKKTGVLNLLICCFVLTGTTAYSQQKSRPSPPRYYADFGACPFECCTYRQWTVTANTVLYKNRSQGSPVAFRVKKGEKVIGLTGVVITLKPGKAVVQKAMTLGSGNKKVQVKAGDVLYLLHYEGEGFYKFWFGGRIYEDEMSFATVSEPQVVWWVKVKNRRGQIGWSKQDEHFGDMDACA